METEEERKLRWAKIAALKKIEKAARDERLQKEKQQSSLENAKQKVIRFPQDFDYHVNYAQLLKESSQFEECVVECKQCLMLRTNNANPFILIIECLIQQKKYDQAQKYAQEMLFKLGSGDNYSYYMNGLIYIHMKQYKNALPYYQKAVEAQPGNEIVEDGLYQCFVGLDRHNDAILCTKKLMNQYPDSIKYQIRYGQDLRTLKQFKNAEIQLKQCLKIHKNNEDCFSELIYCLLDQIKYDEARKYAILMLVELPHSPVSYDINGYVFEKNNQYEKSKRYYQIAMEMDIDNMDTKEGYFYQLLNLRESKEARKFCDDSLAKYPKCAQVYGWSALAYYYQFYLDEALNHYEKAMVLDIENMYYVNLYADVLLEMEKFDLAKKVIQNKWDQQKNDDYGGLSFRYGLILQEERENKEAEKYFQDAIKAKPSDANLFKYRAHLYFVRGEYKQAVEMYKKRLGYFYAVPSSHYYMALSLCKLNRFQDAFKSFKESLKFCPTFPKCHCCLGILLIKKMNKYEEGIYHIKKANEIDPKNGKYLLALKKYQKCQENQPKKSQSVSKTNDINFMDLLRLDKIQTTTTEKYNKNTLKTCKSIKQWSNQDLLNWIDTIGLEVKWKDIMREIIKSTKCNGNDWLNCNNFKDFAKKLNIKQPMLANKVFRAFKKIKQTQPSVSNDLPFKSTVIQTWKNKDVNKWTHYELQQWICSLYLRKPIEQKIISDISEQEITGEDFNSMECVSDVVDSFQIKDTSANVIYEALQKIRMNVTVNNNNEKNIKYENNNSKVVDGVQLLKQWNLIQYKTVLIDEEGYDDPLYWKDISVEELKQMGFKTGHAKKFVDKSSKQKKKENHIYCTILRK
eukprot:87699_1